ncbi:MAG: GNAT family N-acetyltransferase [Sphingomicrobium sp.]
MSEPSIREASSPSDYATFACLCRDYVDWCRARYADLPWFVKEVFDYQSLDGELALLAVKYGLPNGRTMVAEIDGEIVAAGATHRLDDRRCELKRLYVADHAEGHGLGRRLSEALIDAATADGFATIQLDTGDRLIEAIALYRSMGFDTIEPYLTYPDRLLPHLVFMEKRLVQK